MKLKSKGQNNIALGTVLKIASFIALIVAALLIIILFEDIARVSIYAVYLFVGLLIGLSLIILLHLSSDD